MKFRVAIFKRASNRLKFNRFAFTGYKLGQDGGLYRGRTRCNTTDRRGRVFYEVNFLLPKTDRLGAEIYEKDIVFDGKYGALSVVLWNESGCAFVLATRSNGFTVKYRYCDWRDTVERIGNEYESTVKQISATKQKE